MNTLTLEKSKSHPTLFAQMGFLNLYAFALAGDMKDTDAPAASKTPKGWIKDFAFNPQTITVDPEITWTNRNNRIPL